MRIGEARIRPVIELDEIVMPPRTFVSDFGPDDLEACREALCPDYLDPGSGNCRLSHHAWLLEANGKRILVDPCVGAARDLPSLPFFHQIESSFLERLEALGAPAETIDYVFCTHLHCDHCGWNTRELDGRMVPTFPNATYFMSRVEEDFWRREAEGLVDPEPFNAGVYAASVAPVIAAGLAKLVDGGERIADCITLIDAPGHTIGHLAGVLESGGEGAVLAGDAIHHPVQVIYPERHSHSHDPEQAGATRRKLLELCVERDFWLAPAHFRAPHLCKVRRVGDSYRMEWADEEAFAEA